MYVCMYIYIYIYIYIYDISSLRVNEIKVHLVCLFSRICITMHGSQNVKFTIKRRLTHKSSEFTWKGTHISRMYAQDLQATTKQTEQSGKNRNAIDLRITKLPRHFVSSPS